RHNPYALKLLCAESPRPAPSANGGSAEPGSRAEAWQYRTLMRDQWRVTPGALEWLCEQRPG
ncbi:zinc chelation protein SecC, partial [Halomonas elongata]|nr:zinc chelation protein SecC [Halomonas elongata]